MQMMMMMMMMIVCFVVFICVVFKLFCFVFSSQKTRRNLSRVCPRMHPRRELQPRNPRSVCGFSADAHRRQGASGSWGGYRRSPLPAGTSNRSRLSNSSLHVLQNRFLRIFI